jgi:hypothetical protein
MDRNLAAWELGKRPSPTASNSELAHVRSTVEAATG